jgi:hypothetical protein
LIRTDSLLTLSNDLCGKSCDVLVGIHLLLRDNNTGFGGL